MTRQKGFLGAPEVRVHHRDDSICDLYGVHGVNCKKFSMEVIECMKSTFAKLEFLLFLMKNLFIVLVPFAADVSFQLICHHRPEFVVRGPKR